VLYEGRQIYFGRTTEAKERGTMFSKPGLTIRSAGLVREVKKSAVVWRSGQSKPPDEFATAWKNSAAYKELQKEIADYDQQYPIGGELEPTCHTDLDLLGDR
jgi:ATP-binding cassette subfamily G (WHITE) protein 2 (PDR)